MDEPVPRRSFVRLVASDVVQNAGRLASLSGAAAGLVTQGVVGLTDAFDASGDGPPTSGATPARGPSSTDRPASGPRAGTTSGTLAGTTSGALPATTSGALVGTASPAPPRLDPAMWMLLDATGRGWLAVNRRDAGPLVLPAGFRLTEGRISVRGRAGSALALAVAADPHVTLLVDDIEHHQRCLVFGTARVLEGAAAADPSTSETHAPADPDQALIVIGPTHALRTPL